MKETLSHPDPQEDILAALEDLNDLQADSEYHPAEEEAIKRAQEMLADSPTATVEKQTERIGRHAQAEGRIDFANLKAKLETPDEEAETLNPNTPETEETKERSKGILRKIGRAATFPFRKSIDLTKSGTKSFFENGNRKFDEFLKAGEKKFTPQLTADHVEESIASNPLESELVDEADTDPESDDDTEDYEWFNKSSAATLDRFGAIVDNGKEDTLRNRLGEKVRDYAVKVDEREGTYLSRSVDKTLIAGEWSSDKASELKQTLIEAASSANERRKNYILKRRNKRIGKKILSHQRSIDKLSTKLTDVSIEKQNV